MFSHPGVHYLCGFYGPAERLLVDTGANIDFVPSDFRRFTPILEKLKPRVMAGLAAPPDEDGWLSLSLHAGATYHELMRAAADPDRMAIVEINPDAPRTMGLLPDHPHRIHVDQVDVLVESDRPMFTLPDDEPDDIDRRIAAFVRPYIADGSTLQTGIGGIPSTIASMLANDDGGDYGVHSEMFTTGLMHLHQAGKVTNARKGQFDGLSITTFALGTPELNEFLDGNDEVRFLPAEVVNAPEVVARNRQMVTINGALTIDLWGQAVADTIGRRQFSGIGGHEDFVSVAGFELEDRSILCLRSTATVGGQPVSRIAGRAAGRGGDHHAPPPARPGHHRVRRGLAAGPHGARARRGAGRGGPPRLPRAARGRMPRRWSGDPSQVTVRTRVSVRTVRPSWSTTLGCRCRSRPGPCRWSRRPRPGCPGTGAGCPLAAVELQARARQRHRDRLVGRDRPDGLGRARRGGVPACRRWSMVLIRKFRVTVGERRHRGGGGRLHRGGGRLRCP